MSDSVNRLMRKMLVKLHLWTSLVAAVPLFVVGITGAILVYGDELDTLISPDQYYVNVAPSPLPVQLLIDSAKAAYPEEDILGVGLPAEPDRSISVITTARRYIFVNPYSAEILGTKYLESGFRRKVFLLHTRLMAGNVGHFIVIVSTFVAIFLAISGLLLWWKFKTWRLRWWKSWRRMNFDFHNVSGLYTAAVLLILSVTGAVIAYESTAYPALIRLGGELPEAPPMRSARNSGHPVTIDAAIAASEQALNGARITFVLMPEDEAGIFTAYARFPEDPAVSGRSRVFVDQYRGEIVGVRSTRNAKWGRYITNIIEAIHFGDIFGTLSQIVVLIASLLLGCQVVSGLLIWWKRRKPQRQPAGDSRQQ